MQKSMGEIIRNLRKEHGLTQEELAEQLGVTFQAVSKWENNSGLPDISQIVPLASVFNISTDVLFGLYGTDSDKEVSKLIDHALSLIGHIVTRDNLHLCYDALCKGLEKYPNNSQLIMQFLETGLSLAYPDNDCYNPINGESIYKECVKKANIIIKYGKSANDVLRAHMIMVLLHSAYGNTALAREHSQQFPTRADMTSSLMDAYIFHFEKNYADEGESCKTDFLYHLEAMLDDMVELGRCYYLLGDYQTAQTSFDHALAIIDVVCKDTNAVCKDKMITARLHHREKGDIYALLAETYIQMNNNGKALNMLEKMVDYDHMLYKRCEPHSSEIGEKLRLKLNKTVFSTLQCEQQFKDLLTKANQI